MRRGRKKKASTVPPGFEVVIGRTSWGMEVEYLRMIPQKIYTDPVTGKQVTQFPPGYARGAYPPRSTNIT